MPCPEALRADVLAHARAEEQHDVARLTTEGAPSRLRWMTAAMEAAEALASTRPAQGVESAAKNLLLGPVTAVMDRTRDAIRKSMGDS